MSRSRYISGVMEDIREEKIMTDQDDSTARTEKVHQMCPLEGDLEMVADSFERMNLKEELAHGICSYGYSRPSPIQSRAIPYIVSGRDILAQAQSGTGKTATFVISTLQRIDDNPKINRYTQVLVLAPTRELADQIWSVFCSISQYMDIRCVNLIGGISVETNINELREGAHVVVGTPGRVLHMIKEKTLKCDKIKVLVMDEADQMLDIGFSEQIKQTFSYLPSDVQVLLFSATMPDPIIELTTSFMRDPVKIFVKKEELTLKAIRQFFLPVSDKNQKVDAILDIFGQSTFPQTVIFVNETKDALILTSALKEQGVPIELMHSGLVQKERNDIMKNFRCAYFKALVSTDLLARGIDVQNVKLVINFDLPDKKEVYLHRIGRSGRYGRTGMAINLILANQLSDVKDLENFYQTEIKELPEDCQQYF